MSIERNPIKLVGESAKFFGRNTLRLGAMAGVMAEMSIEFATSTGLGRRRLAEDADKTRIKSQEDAKTEMTLLVGEMLGAARGPDGALDKRAYSQQGWRSVTAALANYALNDIGKPTDFQPIMTFAGMGEGVAMAGERPLTTEHAPKDESESWQKRGVGTGSYRIASERQSAGTGPEV